jgi:hypothetical protein
MAYEELLAATVTPEGAHFLGNQQLSLGSVPSLSPLPSSTDLLQLNAFRSFALLPTLRPEWRRSVFFDRRAGLRDASRNQVRLDRNFLVGQQVYLGLESLVSG